MTEYSRMDDELEAEDHSDADLGPGKWVSKQRAAVYYKCGERALEKRVKSGKILPEHYRINSDRKVEIFIKETNKDERDRNQETNKAEQRPNKFRIIAQENANKKPNKAELNSDVVRSLSLEITESSRSQRELTERLLKEIDARAEAEKKLTEQSTQLANLNGERENFTTAIQKRQDDKREIEILKMENETLKVELEVLKQKKKLWQFWR